MNTETLEATKTGLDILQQLNQLRKALSPFKPEVKSMRILYRERISDLTLLLNVPRGIARKKKIEIPAYAGYKIFDMYDESLNKVNYVGEYSGGKWILDTSKLPASEKYLVIMKGRVSEDALDRIVKVHAPKDPKRGEEMDRYWIHSGIKDVSILEKIWEELAIERINVNVNVGIQRYFATSIPHPIKMMLKTRGQLLRAIDSGEREKSRLESFYRYWSRKAKATTGEIYELIRKILSGETFSDFIFIDPPYEIGSIIPVAPMLFIPEGVGVEVETDLNFRRPAAEGYLTFKKKDFGVRVSKDFEKFLK